MVARLKAVSGIGSVDEFSVCVCGSKIRSSLMGANKAHQQSEGTCIMWLARTIV